VDWSGNAHDQLRDLANRAAGRGIRLLLAEELLEVQHRLENRPQEWGDPVRPLPFLGLQMLQGLYSGLMVVYAVDEARRIVYVRDIRAVLNHPLADG
jgi:hypothetical protein